MMPHIIFKNQPRKPIPRFDGYFAERNGLIWGTIGDGIPWCLAMRGKSKGHPFVSIPLDDTKSVDINICRLVCSAFHGYRGRKYYVSHIDGNKMHNDANNLMWKKSTHRGAKP